MKTKAYRAISLIVALLVAVLMTVGYVFAWLVDRRQSDLVLSGTSAGAYFDSGDGSEETPFIIANPTHMHNLAVLQNAGKFVDRDGNPKKYYFAIKETVDAINMSGHYIPPIGNDDNPFIGDFDGRGKTLANLQVTTKKSDLREEYPRHADTDYEFSQAVGLFGMTGESSDIHDVILENPSVYVSATDTLYSATKNAAVGLAVGFVAGKCSSIGVRAKDDGSALDVNVTGYSTFNSILGALGENVTSSVTGGGHTTGTGGSGASFGASFDVEDMVRRLNLIKANKSSSTPSWRLPNVDTSSNYTIPDKGAKMPFSINDATSKYTGADAKEDISDSNVGYFLGNQNKIEQTKEFSFSEPLIDPGIPSVDWYTVAKDGTHESPADSDKVPAWIYKFDGGYSLSGDVYTSQMGFAPLSQDEFDALPQDIKDIFPDDLSDKKRFLKISLSTALWLNEGEVASPSIRLVDDNGVWSYHGQISWMGKTYGEGFRGSDGDAVDEEGVKYSYIDQYNNTKYYKLAEFDKGIMLPNSTIWFKPSQAGKVKIIMFSPGNLRGFALIKITRSSADRTDPFKAEITRDASWNYSSDIELSQVMRVRLPKNVLFYYEYEITQETIDAGNVEYMMVGENNGADFIYLDLGASAAADTSGIDREKSVSAVDFIYDGVEISKTEDTVAGFKVGDFIVKTSGDTATYTRYESSKTSVYFEELKAVLNLVFIRLYSGSTSHTDKTKTICLEKSDPVPNVNSEVKATFATYVCPTISGGSGTVSGGGGGGSEVDPDPVPDTPTVSGVTVTPASATVEEGKTTTLTASVTMSDGSAYGGSIVWTSSDENIATVENGVVTTKAAGTVTITATAGGESATCTVTVTAKQVDPDPTTVTLKKDSGWVTLASGDTIMSNDVVSVNAAGAFSIKNSGAYVQASAGNNGDILTFKFKKGYKYTITVSAGTSGSAARTLTLNGKNQTTGTSATSYSDCVWDISVSSASATDTVEYIMSQNSNCTISSITIVATPET